METLSNEITPHVLGAVTEPGFLFPHFTFWSEKGWGTFCRI